MEPKEVLEELRTLMVGRLKFDAARAADLGAETPLPKGVDGSAGLDSLDFIELSLAIEDRFGIAMDDLQDAEQHFASLGSLSRFVAGRLGGT